MEESFMSITLSKEQLEQLAKAYWKLDRVVNKNNDCGEVDDAHQCLKDVLRAHNILDDWGNIWEEHKD